ncbi:hypothetical protein ACJZ2D_012469 [Fusarium nematophilum]
MARIQIPLDVITSRLNFGDRFQGLRSGPLSGRFSNLRPVSEFLDFKRLAKPANFAEMQSRVNYNLSHFSSNYAVIFVMLSIYALLTNWLLLFDIILVVVGMWFIGRLDGHDLEIGTFRASSSQLYTGLVVVAVPLDGRPRAPEFAPQWGRPSRRRRRRTDGDAAPYGRWDGDARVEELGSDEDYETDSQGVGISSGTATRFISDSLRFTGIDLGDREHGVARRGNYQQDEEDEEDDDDDATSSSEDEEFDEYIAQLAVRDREEALVQSAMRRIERAKARGRDDVSLNKEELSALERRRKRMEDEATRKRRSGKKRREQRIAVPLTQLEPASRKQRSPPGSRQRRQESRPRHSSSNSNLDEGQDRQGYPPMGYFPPPATSGRPRSGTASSRRPPSRVRDERGGPSFEYQRAPSASRHASDTASGTRGAKLPPYGDIPIPGASPTSSRPASRAALNPFQYQVAGHQPQNPMAPSYATQRGVGPLATGRARTGPRQINFDDGTSEEDSEASDDDDSDEEEDKEQSSSDDVGSGAQIRESPRGRTPAVVVEVDPEPEPEPEPQPVRRNPPRASAASAKRKPARGGRRRK